MCRSRRDGVWEIELEDDRVAYCHTSNVIIGHGTSRSFLEKEMDEQETRDDVILTRARLEAERQSEIRLQRDIQSRVPLPFLHNSGEDGSLLNCVQNSTPTLPAALPSVFRTFVNGLKEGLISDAE